MITARVWSATAKEFFNGYCPQNTSSCCSLQHTGCLAQWSGRWPPFKRWPLDAARFQTLAAALLLFRLFIAHDLPWSGRLLLLVATEPVKGNNHVLIEDSFEITSTPPWSLEGRLEKARNDWVWLCPYCTILATLYGSISSGNYLLITIHSRSQEPSWSHINCASRCPYCTILATLHGIIHIRRLEK